MDLLRISIATLFGAGVFDSNWIYFPSDCWLCKGYKDDM